MRSIKGINPQTYYGVYTGLIAEAGMVFDEEFKVQIPQLMPNMEAGAPKSGTVSVDYSKILTTKYDKSKTTIGTRNYFKAKSATFFRTYHRGNVFVNERTKGVTEYNTAGQIVQTASPGPKHTTIPSGVPMDRTVNPGAGAGDGPNGGEILLPHLPISTQHNIAQPLQIFDMIYEDLDHLPTEAGELCVVAVASFKDVYMINIPDKVQKQSTIYPKGKK